MWWVANCTDVSRAPCLLSQESVEQPQFPVQECGHWGFHGLYWQRIVVRAGALQHPHWCCSRDVGAFALCIPPDCSWLCSYTPRREGQNWKLIYVVMLGEHRKAFKRSQVWGAWTMGFGIKRSTKEGRHTCLWKQGGGPGWDNGLTVHCYFRSGFTGPSSKAVPAIVWAGSIPWEEAASEQLLWMQSSQWVLILRRIWPVRLAVAWRQVRCLVIKAFFNMSGPL